MSLHGISKDAWKRYTAEGSWFYEIARPGFKYNLTDVASAIGRVQLTRREEFWSARRRIARRYDEALADCPGIRRPVSRANVDHAWHLYVLQLDTRVLDIHRAAFIDALKQRGIGTSVHFIPLHMHPYYRTTFGYESNDLPNAAAAYARIVSLPIYSRMTDADVDDVIAAVKDVAVRHRRVRVAPVRAGRSHGEIAV
jgi:perosamine synthetase